MPLMNLKLNTCPIFRGSSEHKDIADNFLLSGCIRFSDFSNHASRNDANNSLLCETYKIIIEHLTLVISI